MRTTPAPREDNRAHNFSPEGPSAMPRFLHVCFLALAGMFQSADQPRIQKDPVQILLGRLASEGASERAVGAVVLGSLGAGRKEVVSGLQAALKDENPEVRGASALSLVELGVVDDRVLAIMKAVLSDDKSLEHIKAYWRILDLGPRASPAVPILIELIKDGKADPEFAMLSLASIGKKAEPATKALLPYLGDHKSTRRRNAALALGYIGPPARAAVPALRTLLKDKDPFPRVVAAKALIQIVAGNKEAIQSLRDLIKNGPLTWRRMAILCIRDIGPAGSPFVADITAVLDNKSEDATLHEAAIRALTAIGLPHVKDRLGVMKKALHHPNAQVRVIAATSLLKLLPESRREIIPILIGVLEGKDFNARSAAAKLLGKIGPDAKVAIPSLIKLLDDKRPAIAAAFALCKLDPNDKTALNKLIEFLKFRDELVDLTPVVAATALGELGPQAKPAEPVLLELVDRGETGICKAAAMALVRIQKKP